MRGSLGLVVFALAFSGAAFAGAPPPKSFFLAGDPHVPLAFVQSGTISGIGDHCTPSTLWGPPGSSWRALDAWGQVVATRTVDKADPYDVTGCNELSFRGAPPNDRALYVSTSAPWTPSPSREWSAPPADRASFLALARAKAIPPRPGAFCPPALPDAAFFDVGPAHHAVYGGIGIVVLARRDSTGWVVLSATPSSPTHCAKPVAVFDMNGDGVPEIVMRENEDASWDDYVLQRSATTGAWSTAAESPGGATI